mmetsp:Transcript_32963/g.86468  ORF Transcript_32963/g.86468 Transcript_32963/m.86468 type:complete len:137 (+) Transcript_32963:197-607(+)
MILGGAPAGVFGDGAGSSGRHLDDGESSGSPNGPIPGVLGIQLSNAPALLPGVPGDPGAQMSKKLPYGELQRDALDIGDPSADRGDLSALSFGDMSTARCSPGCSESSRGACSSTPRSTRNTKAPVSTDAADRHPM